MVNSPDPFGFAGEDTALDAIRHLRCYTYAVYDPDDGCTCWTVGVIDRPTVRNILVNVLRLTTFRSSRMFPGAILLE